MHDHRPRRADRELWREPARLAFQRDSDGVLEVAVVPVEGCVYVASLPESLAVVLLPALDEAGRALAPLVGEDWDLIGSPFERFA